MIDAIASIIVGLALTALGYFMIRASKVPTEGTTFSPIFFSRPVLLKFGGWIALYFGLCLALFIGPLVFLKVYLNH